MVRTYKEDNFHLLSPWEKAMRIADSEANSPIQTGKRMFRNLHSSLSSICNESPHLKLPPITEDPQRTIEFLGNEVGKVLVRSKRKLKIIKSEFVLYDPLETGLMSKTAAYEILKRYKLPPNDNYQRKIIAFFIAKMEPGKVDRFKLMAFLENSYMHLHKLETEKMKGELIENSKNVTKLNDSTHGRYEGETPRNEQEYEPRKAEVVNKAFASRRDAGLSLEIARAFTASGKDPNEAIERLEGAIRKTILNERQMELNLVNGMHLKGLVAKSNLPINPSLTVKCIERLDPYNNGEIEWPRFIDFLRKAVQGIETPSSTSSMSSSINGSQVPWENKKPLQDIKKDREEDNKQENDSLDDVFSQNLFNDPFNLPNDYLQIENQNNSFNSIGKDEYMQQSDHDRIMSPPSYRFTVWDPVEQSTSSLENVKDGSASEIDIPDFNDPYEDKIQALGARGEVYRRVADALTDKAMFHNGNISTNDVRKTINYYNMLFDADINLEKINSALDKYSQNDFVDVKIIIDSLGNGAI